MRILIPVDGSPWSDAALAFVAARPLGDDPPARIDVLNVQWAVSLRAARAVGAEIVHAWHEAESAGILAPAIARLRQAGLDPAGHWVVGNPGDRIARWADRHAVDLIVMGARGHSAVRGLVFGSVTQRVLASTSVPVLVLRTPRAPTRGSLAVGVALDGSHYGEAAADYVLRHHRLFGPRPKLALIHVRPPGTVAAQPAEAAAFESTLAPARARLAAARLAVTEQRLCGDPGAEIARYARAARLDLLVLGSHGRGALKAALLGSVATRVAATCNTPLLLIRRPGAGPTAGRAPGAPETPESRP